MRCPVKCSPSVCGWRSPIAELPRRAPLLLAGVAVLLVLRRPRRAVQWLQYGWMGWQVARKLRSNCSQNKTAP